MAKRKPAQQLRLEYIEARNLPPNPRNWRKHPEAQKSALREMIRRLGWTSAIVFNERTNRVIDGHARLEISKPDERVPVLIVSLSEEQELQALASHDTLTGMADHDADALRSLLDDVQDSFDHEALKGMTDKLHADLDAMLDAARDDDGEDGSRKSGHAKAKAEYIESYQVVAMCRNSDHQQEVFEMLDKAGVACRIQTLSES